MGHLAKECRIRKIICFRCHHEGHLSRNCDQPRRQEHKSAGDVGVATISPGEHEYNQVPCINIIAIEEKKCCLKAITDTGSPIIRVIHIIHFCMRKVFANGLESYLSRE